MKRFEFMIPRQGRVNRSGVSLMEVTISTLIIGLLLLAALKSSGQMLRSRAATSDPLRGELLARELLTEILNAAYKEPSAPVFGPESGEATGNRSLFDDVDDWHGWTASPPRQKNGAVIPSFTGWQRSVTVQLVNVANPATLSNTDQGVKRITVTVRKNGTVVAQEVSLRSDKH